MLACYGATAVVLTMPCHFTVARKAPCPAFVGLEYMLLEENLGLSKYVRKEDKQWRILVSMGGSDTWGGSNFCPALPRSCSLAG